MLVTSCAEYIVVGSVELSNAQSPVSLQFHVVHDIISDCKWPLTARAYGDNNITINTMPDSAAETLCNTATSSKIHTTSDTCHVLGR